MARSRRESYNTILSPPLPNFMHGKADRGFVVVLRQPIAIRLEDLAQALQTTFYGC